MLLQVAVLPCPDTRPLFVASVVVVASVVMFTAAVVVVLLRRGDQRRADDAKVAAIGAATARILHQIKNPLQTVVLNADILQDERIVGDPQARREVSDAILGESHRLVTMLDELSAYASGAARKLDRVPLRLDAMLHDVARQGHGGAAHVAVEAEPATVVADAYYLHQLFENLVRNAGEALDDRPDGRIAVRLRVRPGIAEVQVADNGPGIAPHLMDGLFEPFMSTKGKGMGLGLAICREIAEGHGGTLHAGPGPEGGAAFTVCLPLAAGAGIPAPPAQPTH